MKKFAIAPILALSLLLAGFSCNHKAALQTSTGVAASLKALQEGEITLHQMGKVDQKEHELLQQGFIVLAQTDKSVRQCIYSTDAPTCVDTGIAAVNNFTASPAVIGIKNPDSQAQVKLLAQAVTTALQALKAAL